MALPQASVEHYRQQQRLTTATVANMRRLWRQMGGDWDAAWRTVSGRMTVLMVAAQVAAASASEQYVIDELEEVGIDPESSGRVNPRAFGATASDGRPLNTLLTGALIRAKTAAGRGDPDPLAAGGDWLDMAVQTQLADASRGATGVAIVDRPAVTGYVRMLNPPSCARCLVLAGKFYRWNQGFQRHPRCDCRHIPASENIADDYTTDPNAYFRSLSVDEQDRTLTKAGAQAIRDGADIGQVVNARRGMYRAADGARLTTEGTARGRARGVGPRLMPEQIYQVSRTRDEAVDLLRRFGYLI